MSLLCLFCYVLGDDNQVFPVDIELSKTIGHLKDVIKAKGSNMFKNIDAHMLHLWKVSIAIDDIFETGIDKDFDDAKPLQPTYELSQVFSEPPLENHIHIVVKPPADRGGLSDILIEGHGSVTGMKRKREDPVDVSKKLYDKWNVPLPIMLKPTDLRVYLDAPLDPQEKIPISHVEWRGLLQEDFSLPAHLCFPDDLKVLFKKDEDEVASFIRLPLITAISRRPPDSLGTKESFHSFWDDNILQILRACLGNLRWIRNSSKGTGTGSLRPDFGILLEFNCVFRGEETNPTFSGRHPREELIMKTRWVYDPVPYVLGYYAVGTVVTIVTIQPGGGTQGRKQIVVKDVITADLSRRQERIKNAVRMIRLVKVLRTLAQSMTTKAADADMLPLVRENGESIEYLQKKIRKFYSSEDKVTFLKYIYDHLEAKGVPNVDRITRVETSHSEQGCFVELEPRGIDAGPMCYEDVKNAVMSVLEALKVCHISEPQIFHRDIRWPNVMQNIMDPTKWFLIDWEDAGVAPTKAVSHMRLETHAPQVLTDGHGAEVDIWSVGKLILTAGIYNLPENLLSLGQRMVNGSIITAEQGLQELRLL